MVRLLVLHYFVHVWLYGMLYELYECIWYNAAVEYEVETLINDLLRSYKKRPYNIARTDLDFDSHIESNSWKNLNVGNVVIDILIKCLYYLLAL